MATALASVALLAGCGGDDGGTPDRLSKDEYEREYRAAADRVSEPRLDQNLDTPQQTAAVFEEGRKRILRFASEVEKLRPPAEVEQAHRDLVAGLRGTAEDMKPVIELLRKGDEQGVRRILDRQTSFASPRTIQLVQRARAAFEEKGYDVVLESEGVTP